MTRIVVAWSGRVHEATRSALEAERCEYRDTGGSPTAYWELLAELWTAGEDVLVLERSIALPAGAVAVLEACESPWCSCPPEGWPVPGWGAAFLQCNRWRGELMREHPHVLHGIHPVNRHWAGLDLRFLPNVPALCHVHRELATSHPVERLLSVGRAALRRALFIDWACRTFGGETYLAATSDPVEIDYRRRAVRILHTGPENLTAFVEAIRLDLLEADVVPV